MGTRVPAQPGTASSSHPACLDPCLAREPVVPFPVRAVRKAFGLFFKGKTIIYVLCFNLITMGNGNFFLPLCSGLEKDSIISTVARRLVPGHKILIRNNHAALKWEL